jgi:hypothetical protein
MSEQIVAPGLEHITSIMRSKQCTFNDAFFLYMIELGVFSIDDDGRIWKTGYVRMDRFYRILNDVRAEHNIRKYNYVEFGTKENRRFIQASRYVYLYHKGGVPEGMCVQNINGNREDNHPDNLRLITLYGTKKGNLVNILTAEQRMILDDIIKDRVEALSSDGVICVNSHSHNIKKAFPDLPARKLGYMLSIYMLEHHNEWDIDEDNSRSKSKRYRISRKEMPATMTHEAGVVCV